MCVCELQAALGIAQPTVSSHLKVLEEAGLVESAKEGQWVNYSLAAGDMSFETPPTAGTHDHRAASEQALD